MASVYVKERHSPWVKYKTFTSTASALGNGEKKGANVPSDAFPVSENMTYAEIRVAATSAAAGKTGTMHVYGARRLDKNEKIYDDICKIGSVAMVSGAQLSSDNYLYVHSMIMTDKWITEVKLADESANDGMSRIAFNVCGYDVIFVIITYTDDTNWVVDISGWS